MSWLGELIKNEPLALWGAVLSSILAFVKIWEIFKDRFRLNISFRSTSSPEIGNKVIIRNLSKSPTIISYWALVRGKRKFLFLKETPICSAEWDDGDFIIQSHSSKELVFAEESYFSTSYKYKEKGAIYLHLNIAGRKPFFKKIYNFK